jgi:hypothetical protein
MKDVECRWTAGGGDDEEINTAYPAAIGTKKDRGSGQHYHLQLL